MIMGHSGFTMLSSIVFLDRSPLIIGKRLEKALGLLFQLMLPCNTRTIQTP
jgi:hypothetical protein